MLAILNFLNSHNLPIFQPILLKLVSKFMVHRALSDKIYFSLGLLSPLMFLITYCNDFVPGATVLDSVKWGGQVIFLVVSREMGHCIYIVFPTACKKGQGSGQKKGTFDA